MKAQPTAAPRRRHQGLRQIAQPVVLNQTLSTSPSIELWEHFYNPITVFSLMPRERWQQLAEDESFRQHLRVLAASASWAARPVQRNYLRQPFLLTTSSFSSLGERSDPRRLIGVPGDTRPPATWCQSATSDCCIRWGTSQYLNAPAGRSYAEDGCVRRRSARTAPVASPFPTTAAAALIWRQRQLRSLYRWTTARNLEDRCHQLPALR